jgi:hypothetical protein
MTIRLCIVLCVLCAQVGYAQEWDKELANPPEWTKPWCLWYWLDGKVSREGITKDLENLARLGASRILKTGKTFYRPMNRVVHAHIRSIMPENPQPDGPVFLGGETRPNRRFRQLCDLAGIKPKLDTETGKATPWLLKDLNRPRLAHL